MLEEKTHSISLIFPIIILGIFTICGLILIILGSQVYGKQGDKIEKNNQMRNTINYISNKVLASNAPDGVEVDNNIITINIIEDEVAYQSKIYFDNGYLKEAMIDENTEFTLDMGEIITEISGLTTYIDENSIYFEVQFAHGDIRKMRISLRSKGV